MVDVQENDSNPQTTTSFVGFCAVLENLKQKRIEAILWVLRLVTMIFGVLYIIPIGANQLSCYQRAFVAGAATHVFRLHQRLNGFKLSMQFLQQMFLEDACHYALFCLIFVGVYPVTMALMPILLFAALHWTSFTIQLLNVASMSDTYVARAMSGFVEKYSQTCLQVIACCEIFLMPTVVVMLFSGQGNLLIPFVYYRFLTLRYLSRRNPSTRLAFEQLRLLAEQTVNKPACPLFVRNIIYKAISLICRLAPQTVVAG